jgi:hypothetical protein
VINNFTMIVIANIFTRDTFTQYDHKWKKNALPQAEVIFTLYCLHIKLGRPRPSVKGYWLQTTCPSPLWVQILTGNGMLSYELSYGKPVVLLRCPFVPARKGTWGLPPQVKLGHCHMTYTVSTKRTNKQTCILSNLCFIE